MATEREVLDRLLDQAKHDEAPAAQQPAAPSGGTVRSRPLRRRLLGELWPAGLLAWAFGFPMWVAGARFTMDGWVVALNAVMAWLTLPLVIPHPSGYWVLLCIPLGIGYSLVEFRPPGRPRGATLGRWLMLALLWLLVMLSDIGSTGLGMLHPGQDAWPVFIWLAQSLWAAGLSSVLLTFVPELLLIGGWRLIRG